MNIVLVCRKNSLCIGLALLLDQQPDLKVIDTVDFATAKDGIADLQAEAPDFVLIECKRIDTSISELIFQLQQLTNKPQIMVLGARAGSRQAALDAGADGYVLKDDTSGDLLTSIRNVRKGKLHLSPGICDQVINGFLNRPDKSPQGHSWDRLTLREREVLKLIAEGNKSREIAERLSVSIKTVEKHRSNLMRKLKLRGISALTTYAIDNGLIGH